MARIDFLKAAFFDDIPDKLHDGILYISPSSHVALHNCCCGCGEEVVTPLVATEYDLTMHGDHPSIWPSIGNHDYPCGSHYIIDRGKIIWAGKMTRAQIEAGRAFDRKLKRGQAPTGIVAFWAWLISVWRKWFG